MIEIRPVEKGDQIAVVPMVDDFYHSPAVDHLISRQVMERSFQAAADPNNPFLDGYLLLEEDRPVGYCYVTNSYSAEVGGAVALVEELYLVPSCRGKGYGSRVFAFLMERYAQARRIRLEVTPANSSAARLYERLGFSYLGYRQMILDRE